MKTSTMVLSTLVIVSMLMIDSQQSKTINTLIGWKFISYINYNGSVATGDCCDEPKITAGSCDSDKCDTAFEFCGTWFSSTKQCDLIRKQMTPTTFNNTSIQFGKLIGNGDNTTANNMIKKFDHRTEKINLTFTALEIDEKSINPPIEIATFNVVVDWYDPVFQKPGRYRQFDLFNGHVRVVLEIVSMCNKHYYTQDCSVYCRSTNTSHYDCNNNGTRLCHPGWNGTSCDNKIDSCTDNKCLNGSTCVPTPINYKNYTCICQLDFTGSLCETQLSTSTSPMSLTGKTSTPTPVDSSVGTSVQTTQTSSTRKSSTPTPVDSSVGTSVQTTQTSSTRKSSTPTPVDSSVGTSVQTTQTSSTGKSSTPTPLDSSIETTNQTTSTISRSNSYKGLISRMPKPMSPQKAPHVTPTTRSKINTLKSVNTQGYDGDDGKDKDDGDDGADKNDGDGGTAGMAAGVSVGVTCLLLIIAAGAYFIYKKNQRVQVSPKEKQPSAKDKQVAESAKNDEPRQSISITLNQTVGDIKTNQSTLLGHHPPGATGITM